jgi:hypothetical protein
LKSDAPTAAIAAALRQLGASVVYLTSDTDKGLPDLLVATRKGAYVLLEVKDPSGRADCGCTHTAQSACKRPGEMPSSCMCSGHTSMTNSMRKTRHAQLAWAERHPCMRVVVVHSVDEALKACGL